MTWPFRRLPLKTLYRDIELSSESEEMLDEAMVRLDTDDPDVAVKAPLELFLKQSPTERVWLSSWTNP